MPPSVFTGVRPAVDQILTRWSSEQVAIRSPVGEKATVRIAPACAIGTLLFKLPSAAFINDRLPASVVVATRDPSGEKAALNDPVVANGS